MTYDPREHMPDNPSYSPTTEPDGVWVVRSSTLGSIVSIHQTEIAALRAANSNSRGHAEFIPWGKTLVDLERWSGGGRKDA